MRHRVAIVGLGRMGLGCENTNQKNPGHSHTAAVVKHSDSHLVAVCETDPEKLSYFMESYPSIKAYESLDEMLKAETLDLLIIASPTRLHGQMIEKAIAYEVHSILCEKPITDEPAEVEQLIQLVDGSMSKVWVNYQRRWEPLCRQVKLLLDTGAIGEIQHVSLSYCTGIYNDASHLIDWVMHMMGPVEWVQGDFTEIQPIRVSEPNVTGIFKLRSGILGTLQALDREQFNFFEIDIVGRKGRIRSLNHMTQFEVHEAKENGVFEGDSYLIGTRIIEGKQSRFEAPEIALNEILGSASSEAGCTIHEAVDCLKVAAAFVESAQGSGKRIILNRF